MRFKQLNQSLSTIRKSKTRRSCYVNGEKKGVSVRFVCSCFRRSFVHSIYNLWNKIKLKIEICGADDPDD